MSDVADPNQLRLQALDAVQLTPLVRKALDSQTVTVTNWDYQPVRGGVGGARLDTFIYRFTGQGDDQGVRASWSLVLKVLQARKGEHPADPQYWKREAELYPFGSLNDLPGDFSAPHFFGVVEYLEEACWIWMEDIHDEIGSVWPLQHYRTVARHLGQFNGAYLAERPLPSEPWLSSGWFRKMTLKVTPNVPTVLNALNFAGLKGLFPSDAAERYSRLWSERDLFLDELDRLPQTFCHLDVFRRNLVARRNADDGYKTVAIDWAYAGKAALGTEIAQPILVGLLMFEIDAGDASELDRMLFDGYLNGLGDAGWRGDPQKIRLGYSAAVTAKYFELVNSVPFFIDEQNAAQVEQFTGHSFQENRNQSAEMFRFAVRLADEARELMRRLD